MPEITLIDGEKVEVQLATYYKIILIDGDVAFVRNYNPNHDKDGKFGKGSGSYYDGEGKPVSSITKKIKSQGKTVGTEQEKDALNYYSGPLSSYSAINKYLRKGKSSGLSYDTDIEKDPYSHKKLGEVINNIDSLMSKNKTKQNLVVYRNFSLPRSQVNKLTLGSKFKDKGFVSTTLNKKYLESDEFGHKTDDKIWNIASKIYVKKGTSAVFTQNTVGRVAESELVLNRGLSYTIKKMELVDDPGIPNITGPTSHLSLEFEVQ